MTAFEVISIKFRWFQLLQIKEAGKESYWPTWVDIGWLFSTNSWVWMWVMQPYSAHRAASLDFSPQLTPSAISSTALFLRATTANASAIGSPETNFKDKNAQFSFSTNVFMNISFNFCNLHPLIYTRHQVLSAAFYGIHMLHKKYKGCQIIFDAHESYSHNHIYVW